MITIDQLLESVNYQIEPKWVTKDKDGAICIFGCDKPEIAPHSDFWAREEPCIVIYHIKLADFENKDWQECIYEVPSKAKTTNKIDKLTTSIRGFDEQPRMPTAIDFFNKINEIVDAINKLMEK